MNKNLLTISIFHLFLIFCIFSDAAHGIVLVGYWEVWDGPEIHPPVGHVALNTINGNYNVLCVAFPVVMPDGTCILNDSTVDGDVPPTPHEIAVARASGRKVLLSIGGADGGVDLNTASVADKFIESATKVIEYYGFDGIDIDIETGLVAGSNMTSLTPSQTNLIKICDKICTYFRSRSRPDFLLTLTPETAYVTGGSVQFGTVYGSYLPVINALRNKLSWLQVMYYNGILYGKDGKTYAAGTVEGVIKQTEALVDGFRVKDGSNFQGLKQEQVVIGLPAADGSGGGYMQPSAVISAWNTLKAKYPNLGGIMGWSANYDSSSGYDFANKIGPALGIKKLNRPPFFLKPIGNKATSVGKPLTFTLTALDPDKDIFKFSILNNPTGSTLNDATGVFSWTPDAGQSGVFSNIVFKVADNVSPSVSDTEAITITVDKVTGIVPTVPPQKNKGLISIVPNPVSLQNGEKINCIYNGDQTVSIREYIFDATGATIYTNAFSHVTKNTLFDSWIPRAKHRIGSGAYRALFKIKDDQSGTVRDVCLNLGVKRPQ